MNNIVIDLNCNKITEFKQKMRVSKHTMLFCKKKMKNRIRKCRRDKERY